MRSIALQVVVALLAVAMSNGALAQLCPQKFDGVTAPALPAGWSVSTDGAGAGWSTTTTHPQSPPNAAFAVGPNAIGSSYLVSPATLINEANANLTFQHVFDIENGFDGGVLEISIAGAAFQDILAAGGSFSSNGYNKTISSGFMSPIGGRQAFSGSFGAYLTTAVNLPPSAIGKNAKLRWRLATDQSNGSPGWTVDSVDCIPDSAWHYANVPYPIPVLDQATTAMGGTLYSFGGAGAQERGHGQLHVSEITGLSYRYDGLQWTQIGSLPVALGAAVAVNDGTHIFILGGATANIENVATVYRYTPQTNTYETMAPFSTATWATAAVVVNGKIVKFGGYPDATEIYTIATNTWSAGAAYPIAAGFISAFADNGYVYGAGGAIPSGDSSKKAYRYDLVANTWDDAAIPDLPDARAAAATISVPGGALIAGGLTGAFESGVTNTAIAWSSASNSWQSFPSLVAARGRMTGALLNGEPTVIGGCPYPCDFAGTRSVQVLADRIFANGFEQPN